MSSEHRRTVTANDTSTAHEALVVRAAAAAGVDLTAFVNGKRNVCASKVYHYALARAVGAPPPPCARCAVRVRVTATLADRLNAALARSGLTAPEVARGLGLDRTAFSRVIKGNVSLEGMGGGAMLAWIERVEAAAPAQGEPPTVEDETARDTTPDVGRLLAALTRAKLRPGQADRAAGVAKGTARNTLGGLVALDKAGGGALLAWVASVEAAG